MAAPVHQIMLKGAEKVLRCRDGAEKMLRCRDGAEKVLRWCRGAELVVRFLLYPDSIFFPSWGTPQVLEKYFCRRSIKSLYSSIGLSVLIKNITLFLISLYNNKDLKHFLEALKISC